MDYYEVQQSRLIGATIVSTIAGHLAGIIYHVTLGELSMELAAYLILAGGITGGLLHGRTFRDRRQYNSLVGWHYPNVLNILLPLFTRMDVHSGNHNSLWYCVCPVRHHVLDRKVTSGTP